MKMHHIGVVTREIEKDKQLYEALGYAAQSDIVVDGIQNNRLLFMKGISGELIELIEPLNEQSTVYNLGSGYAHICYETESIELFADNLKKNKLGVIFTKPMEAPALNGRNVVFAYLRNKTIIEIIEK